MDLGLTLLQDPAVGSALAPILYSGAAAGCDRRPGATPLSCLTHAEQSDAAVGGQQRTGVAVHRPKLAIGGSEVAK
jgi:hypothetical protein